MTTPTKEQIEGYVKCLKKAQEAHKMRFADSQQLDSKNFHYGGFLALSYALEKAEELLRNSPK